MSSGVKATGPSATLTEPKVPTSTGNEHQTAKTSDVASQIFSGMASVISVPFSLIGRVSYAIWTGVRFLIHLVSQAVSSILNPSKIQKPTQPKPTRSEGVSKLIQSYTEDVALKGKSNTEKVAHLQARIAKIEKRIGIKNAYCKKAEEKELAHAKKEVTEMHGRLTVAIKNLSAEQKELESTLCQIEHELAALCSELIKLKAMLEEKAPGMVDKITKLGEAGMSSGAFSPEFVARVESQPELIAQIAGLMTTPDATRDAALAAFEQSNPGLMAMIMAAQESPMMGASFSDPAFQAFFVENQPLIFKFGEMKLKIDELQNKQYQIQEKLKKLPSRLAKLQANEAFYNIEDSAPDERFFQALSALSQSMLAEAQSLKEQKADLLAAKAHFEALEAKEKGNVVC